MPSRSTAKEEDEEKNELVVIVYDLVLVEENFAKHKATDGITITEVDSASGHLSHDDLLDEGEVFCVLDSGGHDKDLQGDMLLIRKGATQSPPLRNQVLDEEPANWLEEEQTRTGDMIATISVKAKPYKLKPTNPRRIFR